MDRITRFGDMTIRNSTYHEGAIGTPHFEGTGGRRGVIDRTIGKSDVGFLIAFSIVTIAVALSIIIRPQFAIECPRRSVQPGVGDFGSKF